MEQDHTFSQKGNLTKSWFFNSVFGGMAKSVSDSIITIFICSSISVLCSAVLHLEFGASEKCLVVNREKDIGLSEAEGQWTASQRPAACFIKFYWNSAPCLFTCDHSCLPATVDLSSDRRYGAQKPEILTVWVFKKKLGILVLPVMLPRKKKKKKPWFTACAPEFVCQALPAVLVSSKLFPSFLLLQQNWIACSIFPTACLCQRSHRLCCRAQLWHRLSGSLTLL